MQEFTWYLLPRYGDECQEILWSLAHCKRNTPSRSGHQYSTHVLVTQDQLRCNSLFNLPLKQFLSVWESADMRVGMGEDGGDLHLVGQIIMGIEEVTGTKGCDFSQDSPLPFAAFHPSCMVKVASSIIYIGTYYFLPCIAWFALTSFHPSIQF